LNSRVKIEEVKPAHDGQRVDNWLAARLKGVPRSLVYRLLRTGQVRVNGRRARPSLRLVAGDRVRIPPVRTGEQRPPPKPDAARFERLRRAVLYEDERIMVLGKATGMAVHAGSGVSHGLIEILNAGLEEPAYYLVHRLDRDTSGCLLLAKDRATMTELHALMRRGGIGKQYLALVQGQWKGGARTVDAPLSPNRERGGERMTEVSGEGRRAATRFVPRQAFPEATLMEATLDTGRKHQIRVHAAHEGHPVAGDRKYGDAAFNKRMKKLGLKRLFLHAHRLHFAMPDGREVDVTAPLPDDLRAVLDAMETD